MPMTDQMWIALLNDVENTLNMVERVGQNELSTGFVVKYEDRRPKPVTLTNYELWRLTTLQLLLEVWGDIDDEKYQALKLRMEALQREHERTKNRILASPAV